MRRVKGWRWIGVAVGVVFVQAGARGGTAGDAGVARICPTSETVCKIAVTANRVSGSNCQISVAERVRFQVPVSRLNWTLAAAPGNGLLYRFRPGDGLVIDGNPTPGGTLLFEREAASSGPVSEVQRVLDRNLRESTYAIQLQWRASSTAAWNDCDLLDPRILNDGP